MTRGILDVVLTIPVSHLIALALVWYALNRRVQALEIRLVRIEDLVRTNGKIKPGGHYPDSDPHESTDSNPQT